MPGVWSVAMGIRAARSISGIPAPAGVGARLAVARSAGRRGRALESGLRAGAIAGALLAVGLAGPVLADGPSPTPLVFHTPQYLVWFDGHATSNGPVEDKRYALYVAPPDADGHWAIPDGTGSVFHYSGRLVAGPFTTAEEACPAMRSAGVTSLEAWRIAAGEDAQIVDCAAGSAAPGGGTTGSPGLLSTPFGNVSPLVSAGLALLAVGTVGVLVTRRPAPRLAPSAGPAAARPPGPQQPPPDPCADQARELAAASLRSRYLNTTAATGRQYAEVLQSQIDVIANLTLPGSVVLDLGMMAGALSGAAGGPAVAIDSFFGRLAEGVLKDVLKEAAKQALGSPDFLALLREGKVSTAKGTYLEAFRQSLVNRHFFGSPVPISPTVVARDQAAYGKLLGELREYGDKVAQPIADALGVLMDGYGATMDAAVLHDHLEHLRSVRDRLLDQVADTEQELGSALERHQFAAERLDHCRQINAPGWRP